MQTVAAFFRNHVQLQAAGRRIGGTTAGLINHLLVAGIVQVALDSAIALKPVDDHPIHQNRSLRGAGAMHRKIGLLHRLRSAHVGQCQLNTKDELSHGLDSVCRGHQIEHVSRKDLRLGVRLQIHDRSLGCYGYRLFDGADCHLNIDGRRKVRRQLDFTLDCLEPWQTECQCVNTRP